MTAHRYEPPREPFITKKAIFGAPDMAKATTAHIERHNGTPAKLRVTPAMAAGVTDHVWELPEFMDALLSAPPCEPPVKQPLAPRIPEGPARELPNGRGFLRLVPSTGGPSAPSPGLAPVAPLSAVAAAHEPTRASPVEPTGQLDLFAWKPRPAPEPLGGRSAEQRLGPRIERAHDACSQARHARRNARSGVGVASTRAQRRARRRERRSKRRAGFGRRALLMPQTICRNTNLSIHKRHDASKRYLVSRFSCASCTRTTSKTSLRGSSARARRARRGWPSTRAIPRPAF